MLTYIGVSSGVVNLYASYQSMLRRSKSYPLKSGTNPGKINGGNIAFMVSANPNICITLFTHIHRRLLLYMTHF